MLPSALFEVLTMLLGSNVLLFRFVRAPGTPIVFSVDEWNLTIIVLFIFVLFILLMLCMLIKF